MQIITARLFSEYLSISERSAQRAFERKEWGGHRLPIHDADSHRGGSSGRVSYLNLDLCSDALRAKLGLPAMLPETPVQTGVNARPRDGQIAAARDKLQIIEPILKTPAGSSERAEAFRQIAAQHHAIGGTLKPVAERTLRDWVKAAETNVATLATSDRKDTQQDVALSLYDVLTCRWGGVPDGFTIDNGGEFNFLAEAVVRFAKMAGQTGPRVVTCGAFQPEGKGMLERAFAQLEQTFISALPGYNGGNPLKPRLKARGKPVDPYRETARAFAADVALAVAQFNGTEQDGKLGGLSPKAMLEAKAVATGWSARQIDPNDGLMFDLVFSREELRDVRQGNVTIGGRTYSGNVLADLIGEQDVSILVPYRDPTGPVLILHKGTAHYLTHDTVAMNDLGGAMRKAEMLHLQKEELARREAKAAPVDVQEMLSAAADLGPVEHNPPDTWRAGIIDKGGFLTRPLGGREAREREDEEARAFLYENILGFSEGPAAATAGPSGAT